MSTIADYSVFTKAFLASGMTDFSQLYGNKFQGEDTEGFRAFAVIPSKLTPPLTPREAMNLDLNSDWLKFGTGNMWDRVSCRDADGNFIGNIVRIQPGVREGSIRLVAKVAIPAANEQDVADTSVNTFVLVRMNSSTGIDLPIAVATISKGYMLHKHLASGNDPLDDVENANYVSFTINHLNGYTSVDFNPDAYATYDDVANALSRGIDGLHIAFDTASGDLKLLDKDGNVLDQANLPIKADVIIADGEEGYKYVKTDVKQDIHAAKAWMPEGKTAWEAVPAVDYEVKKAALVVGKGSSRVFECTKPPFTAPISTKPVPLEHVVIDDSTYMLVNKTDIGCALRKVKGKAEAELAINADISDGKVTLKGSSKQYPIANGDVEVDVIEYEGVTYVLVGPEGPSEMFKAQPISGEQAGKYHDACSGTIGTREDPSTGGVVGITLEGKSMYTFEAGATAPSEFKDSSGQDVTWFGTKAIPEGYTLKYGLEAFVWTVKDSKAGDKISDPFFKQLNASLLALGFHEGDDIALGTNLSILAPTDGVSPLNGVDADEYIHGKDNKAARESEVDTQRANAKEELAAWNAQHPALAQDRRNGTIIDSSGLDVRNGRITLGCGRTGEEGEFQKVNYGIQMRERFGVGEDHNTYDSLDFTISHHTGPVQFDANGHAAQLNDNDVLEPLTSSTLLSIEAGSYISGAPTCLILAKVTRKPKDASLPEDSPDPLEGSPVLTPIRMTAGFSVEPSYDVSSGLTLTLHDDRDNITAIFVDPNNHPLKTSPAIIEVQAIYTHRDARNANETVPAQQMHTYIGSWALDNPPHCSFLCNKIEEWMTAIDLTDISTEPDISSEVGLYVVIRVY